MYTEEIPWIEGTPLGLKIREVESVPPHMHENIIEIIFCLKGSVKFDYEYEQFTLHAGEFISVDKDAHYLYNGEDDICVSFYIDLEWFKEKYPFVTSTLFVCEFCKESITPHRDAHNRLKGMLLALLYYLGNYGKADELFKETLISGTEKIVDLFVAAFDIVFFYRPGLKVKPELLERYREMNHYIQTNSEDKISLNTMAEEFHLTEAYVSEFFRYYSIGFRKCLGYNRTYKSEKYLLATDMNINEISENCGFSDPKYYYSAFKEWYKCTPKQFRDSYREKMDRPCKENVSDVAGAFKFINSLILKHYMNLFLA
ncbi:MAG: AraC family transcriptional regulator [Eubacteriaceae bacterium]|nr:AraC family transcriptional regulator [Eubacteriaceae bacterium]